MPEDKFDLPLGFTVEKDEKLLVPYVITHKDKQKQEMVRDAIATAPLATLGAKTADLAGAVSGTIFATGLRAAREKRLEK